MADGVTNLGRSLPSERPSLSLTRTLLLNSVIFGLDLCGAAGFTYIPPLLLKVGLDEKRMSFVIGIGPFIGMILLPVLARASDGCRSTYGRRRSFILMLGIGCIISLFLIPYSQRMPGGAVGADDSGRTYGILTLCAGVVLLDFTTQVCHNPCQALLSDISEHTNQKDSIFTVYSIMTSLGGCFGYIITAIEWKSSSAGTYFDNEEQIVFSLVSVLFVITLLTTLIVAKEQPLVPGMSVQRQRNPEDLDYETSSSLDDHGCTDRRHGCDHEACISDGDTRFLVSSKTNDRNTHIYACLSVSGCGDIKTQSVPPSCLSSLLSLKNKLKSHMHRITQHLKQDPLFGLQSFLNIPVVLKRSVVAVFCSWTSVMGFAYFYTDFVGQSVYGGNPKAPINSPMRNLYDQGVRMGSLGLLLHCVILAVSAPVVTHMCGRLRPRKTFICGMLSSSIAMFLVASCKHVVMATLMAAVTGLGLACVTMIPFTLVTEYHANKQVYFFDSPISLPESGRRNGENNRGIALDMAMLDSAYFLSSVVLSVTMGYLVYYAGSRTTATYMIIAGVAGLLSCLVLQRIVINQQELLALSTKYNIESKTKIDLQHSQKLF